MYGSVLSRKKVPLEGRPLPQDRTNGIHVFLAVGWMFLQTCCIAAVFWKVESPQTTYFALGQRGGEGGGLMKWKSLVISPSNGPQDSSPNKQLDNMTLHPDGTFMQRRTVPKTEDSFPTGRVLCQAELICWLLFSVSLSLSAYLTISLSLFLSFCLSLSFSLVQSLSPTQFLLCPVSEPL